MIRKQIYLGEDMNNKINEISASRGIPQSEIIRESLEIYLSKYEEKIQDWDSWLEQMKQSDLKIETLSRDAIYTSRVERYGHEL